jgi:hypothetical protein
MANPNVAKANLPKGGARKGAVKGNAQVGSKGIPQAISVGKMASVPKVTLGTTHGKHDVSHPC